MQLPILIEPLPEGKGFVATLGAPFALSVTADTAAEAFSRLQTVFRQKLDQGTQIAALIAPVPAVVPPPPGWLPDDELTQDWLKAVEEYRKECDIADRKRILGESDEEKVAS